MFLEHTAWIYIHSFVCSTLMWLHHHGHCQFMADSCIGPYSAGLCHQFRSWGRHQIETFLALLALCVCSSPVTVTGAFPLQIQIQIQILYCIAFRPKAPTSVHSTKAHKQIQSIKIQQSTTKINMAAIHIGKRHDICIYLIDALFCSSSS